MVDLFTRFRYRSFRISQRSEFLESHNEIDIVTQSCTLLEQNPVDGYIYFMNLHYCSAICSYFPCFFLFV